MRILVDLTSLSYHITGIERYALCVTEEILLLTVGFVRNQSEIFVR